MSENPTLIINRSDTKCGNCGRGASYQDRFHDKIWEYALDSGTKDGCGITWTQVESHYVGLNMKERCLELRPDLKWVGIEE